MSRKLVVVSVLGHGYVALGSGRLAMSVTRDGRAWYGTIECSELAQPLQPHEFYFLEMPSGQIRQVLATSVVSEWPHAILSFRGLGDPPDLDQNVERCST